MNHPKFLMIDLFCGAGGTSTGAQNSGVCKVIAAINHDPIAIASHSANHGAVLHMTEDILIADTRPISEAIAYWKLEYPDAKVVLWASLECTNFSNAKGGLPRDADSRTLAHGLFRYIDALEPEYLLIENVREFMSWGDLDEKGKPVSKTAGREYVRWVKKVQAYGYNHDWRMLNAANFGGVTIRERYFGAFWKKSENFSWPQPTHVKRQSKATMFTEQLKPWRAVAEVLDFSDLGNSIFDRKIPLVDKTLRRILSGLRKFHNQPSIMICNTPGYCADITKPICTLTTVNSKALVTPMIFSYYTREMCCRSITDPAPTVTVQNRNYLMSPILQSYYSGSHCTSSINQPAPTVPTKDRFALVTPWIDRNFRTGRSQPISEPAGALLTVPKINLCSAFIVNPQYKNKGNGIYDPAPTVIATQRSRPLSLATCTGEGLPRHTANSTESDAMSELKAFMRENGIADIFMRMLKVIELKRIQGFPDDYVLKGPLDAQKKHIGNSVETGVVKSWFRAMAS